MEGAEARYSGQLLKVQRIGKMILDVVHHPVHPGGIFSARRC
jgi:hypothetical protein